jgi:glycerophosphoryl diester phosphodiesterase
MTESKMIIAHRGASFYEKENTMAAFKKAVELKADMIELDVRKTKDNKMIVFHDDKIEKKNVLDMNHREVNENIGYNAPLFEEVLKYFKGIIKLDIHLKEAGYEEEAINLILKYYDLDDFFIGSELPSSLEKIKKLYPEIKTGLLLTSYFKDILFFILKGFNKKEMYLPYVDILIPRWQFGNFVLFNKARKHNKKVILWTVNNKNLASKFFKQDVVIGLVSDRPEMIK